MAPTRVPAAPPGVAVVREDTTGAYPLWIHPHWQTRFPWLVQGTTGRGADALDLGLFGSVPTGTAQQRWRELRAKTHMRSAVHARQVHEARVLWHDDVASGVLVADDADGHATRTAGLLLTVSVADCVPISIVAPERRAIALLHGGWRGVAAGILEAGIALLRERALATPSELWLHCGPSICGACYEVGPEVPAALGIAHETGEKVRLDVRAEIARRALRAGLAAESVTLSAHCTRCGGEAFWSHRGGCRERQLGVLGIRDDTP